eukprot:GHUV01042239.1.p2 GENE.GHUV01042239.1~~GHUV01042239.1.p2  ORF type:complete len:295 (+),score=57.95 GHUV01042239.1:1273-2157(+)
MTSSLAPALAQLAQIAANDSIKVSQAFSSWCSSNGFDTTTCGTITTAIIRSPGGNLARRPGMLCTLAGKCPTGCKIPLTNANGTIISRELLDMCTDSGTVSGIFVPRPVPTGSTCLADSDCTASGAWCDLGAAATQVCKCAAGLDVCNIVGQCNPNRCPLYASITSQNTDLAGCSQSSDCSAGFECQLTPYQTYNCTYTTQSGSILAPRNHSGYCVEAAPSLQSAKLDDNAASIMVALSVAASGFTTTCSAIFSDKTVAKLGSSAICSVDPYQLDSRNMSILLQVMLLVLHTWR